MRNKTALTQNLFPATWIHTDPQTPQYMEFCQGIQGLQFAWADLFELALSARSSGAAKARAQPLRWAAARTTPATTPQTSRHLWTSLDISRYLSTSLNFQPRIWSVMCSPWSNTVTRPWSLRKASETNSSAAASLCTAAIAMSLSARRRGLANSRLQPSQSQSEKARKKNKLIKLFLLF